MKSVLYFTLFITVFVYTSADLQCSHGKPNIPQDWLDMVPPCVREMRKQIQEELKASMQYLAMGAWFSKDTVNRPGFAKMFFESASEERDHAIKLISYLLMRGELTSKVNDLIQQNLVIVNPNPTSWDSAIDALRDALKLEASVTKKIRNVIKVCEDGEDTKFNDYHLVDYLTGDFLEEQYNGQREIAGKISTLDKLMDKHGAVGEFLYDKKLLNGEL